MRLPIRRGGASIADKAEDVVQGIGNEPDIRSMSLRGNEVVIAMTRHPAAFPERTPFNESSMMGPEAAPN